MTTAIKLLASVDYLDQVASMDPGLCIEDIYGGNAALHENTHLCVCV